MLKRPVFFIAIIFVFGLTSAYATWQQPDILIYKGATYNIYTEPMEAFFKAHPGRRPPVCETNSGLWRGYVATMMVVNDELTLKDITIPATPNSLEAGCQKESALEKVAPDGKPLKIDWISGLLLSMDGRNDGDSYSFEFLETFESYSAFEFDSGNLRKAKHFTNKEYKSFRLRQFNAFKKTADYQKLVKEVPVAKRAENDQNILKFVVLYYSKKFLVE